MGGQVVDFRTVAQSGPVLRNLPQCDDPLIDNAYEFQGQVAQFSQNVQVDEAGEVLFFAVDGRIYDRKGRLLADEADADCQVCLEKGSSEILFFPVPGSCLRFYVVTTRQFNQNQEMSIDFGVLDLTLPSDLVEYTTNNITIMGRFIGPSDDAYLDDFAFTSTDVGTPVEEVLNTMGTPESFYLHRIELPLDDEGYSDAIHMDVVRLQNSDLHVMVINSEDHLTKLLWTPTGPRYLGTEDVIAAGLLDRTRSAKGELEVQQDGSELVVAYSHALRFVDPVPDINIVAVGVWRFDLSGIQNTVPTMPRIADPSWPRLYQIDNYAVTYTPAPTDPYGTLVDIPRCGGLEFSPNGRYIYFQKSSTSNTSPSHLGYIDLDLGIGSGVQWLILNGQPGSLPTVDGELELNIAPDGNGWAVYAVLADGLGGHRLACLRDPDQPNAANWVDPVIGVAQPATRPFLDGVEYRLLNSRVRGDTHLDELRSPGCCGPLLIAKDDSRTIDAGTATWSPGDNPFCDTYAPILFNKELRLAAGAHITAQDLTFAFSADGALIIDPGASLTCTNCTFTSACPGEQWKGIEVTGTITQHQYGGSHPTYQGELVLLNSQVWKAEVGILTAERLGGSINGFTSGGVVRCTNTTFRNCRTAVQFMPYQGSQPGTGVPVRNRSSFRECTFSIDNSYPVALDFKHHAYLWHVDGIPFTGCTFENLRGETNSHERGYGIYSLDAHYEVREKCNTIVPLGQECPAGSYDPSTFTGLDHGIHALTSITSRAFVVDRAAFDANVCGVYASGVVGYRVTRSAFTLGNSVVTALTNLPLEFGWDDRHRGLYSFRSHGFIVEDNTLAQTGNHTETEGIVIGYSGAHNDVVRRNTATGLERAFIGEGICAETSGGQSDFMGLQLLCNTNVGNQVNLWDRKVTSDPGPQGLHSIRTFQGHPPLLNGVPTRPGANVFDQSCGVDEWDYERTSTYALLNYFYGQTAADEPLCYTIGYVAKQALPPAPGDPCPVRSYRPRGVRSIMEAEEVKSELQAEKLTYGNTRYLYDQLLDGGSTDEVVLEIMSSWPQDAWQLRDHLMALSPFVSTTALKEMVMRNVMPAAMVTEVLVANPDATKQEGFVPWMQEESGHPLPAYLLNMVYASWEELNYRSTLLGTMAHAHAGMTQHAHDLLEHYRADTLHDDTDSLRWAWQQVRTPAARYSEALTYLQQGQYTAANAVVENIPVEHELRGPDVMERQRMLDMIAFCQQIVGSGRTMAGLTPAEQDALEALVDGAHDRPAVWARNLLCFVYDRCAAPLTGGELGPRMLQVAYDPAEEAPVNTLSVYPNPSNAWVAMDYAIGSAENAWIMVTDVTGRQVFRVRLAQLQGQHLIDARHLQAGAYGVELIVNGEQVDTQKLIIQ